MQPTAIVAGGAGFIGRHVCRELSRQGFHVLALGHGSWTVDERSRWGVNRWQEADIDTASLRKLADGLVPTVLLHCAGSGSVSSSYSAPYEDHQRTVGSTASLLEFARQQPGGAPRVVLTSSAAVYGDQGDVDSSESAIRSPISPYGFNKVTAEALGYSYSRFFAVPVSVVRLFSVYGEGLRKQLLWDAACKLERADFTFFGTGHELRDWIHVDDASQLLVRAATTPQARYEIYNGGNVQAATLEVLSLLARAACSSAEPVFTGQLHNGNPRRLTANCSHASRQLGWTPKIGLQEGLERYVRWFRDHR